MDNSEASTTEDELSEKERNVRIFATQMLKQRLFVGSFKERRRVDPLNEYRDVIVINDVELQKDIDVVRKRLRDFYKDCWIGITRPDYIGAPYGHCLWVTPEDDYTLGSYLYKIKSVKFRRNEIIIRVKHLRALDDITAAQNSTNESMETQVFQYIENFSWERALNHVKKSFWENAVWLVTNVLTVDNIKEAITFLSVLVVTFAAFSIKSVEFFLNFILKFMRELSYLIRSFTPFLLSVVDLFAKIIGGFYILIASMYRDSRKPQPPHLSPAPRYLRPGPPRYQAIEARQSLPVNYYRPSSVRIREIEN